MSLAVALDSVQPQQAQCLNVNIYVGRLIMEQL